MRARVEYCPARRGRNQWDARDETQRREERREAELQPNCAKRLECDQLAGAFGRCPAPESGSKLHALHTLREVGHRRTTAACGRFRLLQQKRQIPFSLRSSRLCGFIGAASKGRGARVS